MTNLEIFQKMREYLSDPSHWNKWTLWKDQTGYELEVKSENLPKIVSCCARGAFHKIVIENNENFRHFEALQILNSYASEFSGGFYPSITTINDSGDHQNILDFLDKVIEREKALQE